HGLSPKEATRAAMSLVSGPVIAVGLVLAAVFVPCAFITGITGQFFRQFALTIAVSTVISAFNSLTLSPALTALLLRQQDKSTAPPLPRLAYPLVGLWLGYEFLGSVLSSVLPANFCLAISQWIWQDLLAVYAGLLVLTYFGFNYTPKGFIPNQDKGYLLVNVQLPDSASVQRTDKLMRQIEQIALKTPGVKHTVAIAGQSILLNANAPNFGAMYVMLKDFHERLEPELHGEAISEKLQAKLQHEIIEGLVNVFGAPPVEGLGTAG